MTKLERLKQKAVDAEDAYVVAEAAKDAAVDLWHAADAALANADDELEDYLEEQDK